MVTLSHGSSCQRYLIVRYIATHTTPEVKRPGCVESEVLLAFPTTRRTEDSTSTTLDVYAFLPIRAYGFQVCVKLRNCFYFFHGLTELVHTPMRFPTDCQPTGNRRIFAMEPHITRCNCCCFSAVHF